MRNRALLLWLALAAATLLVAPAVSAVDIDWVYIGNPGNPADTASNCWGANCGSVSYGYYISKYEVTNAQYAEFLNAKAATDTYSLYSPNMGYGYGGITQSGVSGNYTYSAISGREDMPVNWLGFYDAVRFSNWLNNGQGSGDTETGAYTLLGGTANPSNGLTVTRSAGASIFLTSENEWYKAAYYDALSTSYFDYPEGTDTQTVCAAPGATANTANCNSAVGDVTGVGSYTGSASPYGIYDQGGNVQEWNDQIAGGSGRGVRGGSFATIPIDASYLASPDPSAVNATLGFRVASIVPEPSTGLLLLTGLLGLAYRQRRNAALRGIEGKRLTYRQPLATH